MFFRIPEPIKALQSAWSGIISDLLYNDLINHGLNTLVEQDRERKSRTPSNKTDWKMD